MKNYLKNLRTPEVKRWTISTLITFFSAFFLSLSADVANLDGGSIGGSILLGILVAAFRAGIKAIVEFYIYCRKK